MRIELNKWIRAVGNSNADNAIEPMRRRNQE
jgi:hypothetical protein